MILTPLFLQSASNVDRISYFYIECLGSNDVNIMTFTGTVLGDFAENVEYSVNSLENWDMLDKELELSLNAGDKVYFRNYTGNDYPVEGFTGNSLLTTNSQFNAGGSLKDLLYPGLDVIPSYGFAKLFENLPIVSAAKLDLNESMFDYAFYQMFNNCSSLVEAPSLPMLSLSEHCYDQMFNNCTSLVEAPLLPAIDLVNSCYFGMFSGCSSLNSITCLAETFSSSNTDTNYWLYGVSESGIFIKSPNMDSWTRGNSGIPDGWTILNK